jgi:acetyltransferase-like isoleucine patch superfamily enzyme
LKIFKELGFMLKIGKDVKIHPSAVIEAKDGYIGDRTIIHAGARIEGTYVAIGRESFLHYGAYIGGGSCFDPDGRLEAGDWLHMGVNSHINIARKVKIGHEFGCGIETKIFTHGAYPSAYDGFPVSFADVEIGDNVWMPNAWVNPGVKVGSNVVIAARSLINKDIQSGCFAGGVPCKVLRENCYPAKLSSEEKENVVRGILLQSYRIFGSEKPSVSFEGRGVWNVDKVMFDLEKKIITGNVTDFSEVFKNQLRRNGIRFRFAAKDGSYVHWDDY